MAPQPAEAKPAAVGTAQAVSGHDVPPWEDLPPEAYADSAAVVERVHAVSSSLGAASEAASAPAPAPVASASVAAAAEKSVVVPEATMAPDAAAGKPARGDAATLFALGDWRGLVRALELGGLVRELAQHCEWVDFSDEGLQLRLSVAHRHLLDMNPGALERLQDSLSSALGRTLKLRIIVGDIAGETPAQRDEVERRARHAEAVAALEADPFVRELIERFDATLVESTVKPL